MARSHPWVLAVGVFLAVDSVGALAGEPGEDAIHCAAPLQDFSRFQICFSDPDTGPAGLNCPSFDFDGNGTIDVADYAMRTFVLRPRITVVPASVRITYSQQVDFNILIFESGSRIVRWFLHPVPGGEPGQSLGTIDGNGLYTPPSISDLHAAAEVIVEASRAGSVQASDFACVTLYGTLPGRPLASVALPGFGGGGGLAANVTTAHPPVGLVRSGAGGQDGSAANVTVAFPPTAAVLPGVDDSDLHPPNVTVGTPPVALVLPGEVESELFTPNTTVANPPVALEFEDAP